MGSQQLHEHARLKHCKVEGQFKGSYTVILGNVADNFAVDPDLGPTIVLGASAVRDILLPAATIAIDGLELVFLSNSSVTTGVLTFKTSADAALVPAVTLVQLASKRMKYLHGLGWFQIA